MASFRYRALTRAGDVVSGTVSAITADEATRRVEVLGLLPIEAKRDDGDAGAREGGLGLNLSRPRSEDVTIFTGDLALLLRTGARINEALELLAGDAENPRMRATTAALATAILSGESFAEAIARRPDVFPPIYVALTRVGEASGALAPILEALFAERQRTEALRRRIGDALRYPAFLLIAASGVLVFFLTVVLPQFANVFRDFHTRLDPVLATFLALSDFLRANGAALAVGALAAIAVVSLALRRERTRAGLIAIASRAPFVRTLIEYRRATLFCRNLNLLLASGVTLSASLRILADMMGTAGTFTPWSRIVDKVRHGGKLSDALMETRALPPMAIRTLRLGEESGQLATLAARVADFYEARLQRSLDRTMGFVGPLAIIVISLIVGGLIVSVMTALISVNQVVD